MLGLLTRKPAFVNFVLLCFLTLACSLTAWASTCPSKGPVKLRCASNVQDLKPLETMNFAKSIENELDNFDIPSGGVTLPSGHQGGQLTIAGTGDHPSIGIFLPAVQNFKAAVNTFTTGNKKLQPKDLKLVCNKTQAADDDCDSEYRRLAFDLQSLVEGDGGGSLHVENGLNCLTATYVYVKNTALLGPAQQLALVTYSLIGLISARDTHEPLQNSKAIDRYLTTLNI